MSWKISSPTGYDSLLEVLLVDDCEPHTQQEWDQLKAFLLFEQKWRCDYCAKPLVWATATFDHNVPRSRRGSHNRCNLSMACQRCNSRKGARTPVEWSEAIKAASAAQ
jgi:5-methylcytosine-specific restriction endonuclease McrA